MGTGCHQYYQDRKRIKLVKKATKLGQRSVLYMCSYHSWHLGFISVCNSKDFLNKYRSIHPHECVFVSR